MNEFLIQQLRTCTSLPTLPIMAVKILKLASHPDTCSTHIADCLAFDPALSAKILKIANSPLYIKDHPALNLRHAVNRLGTNAAITIALSFSLVRNLKNYNEEVLFWKRSILSALACRALAQRFGFDEHDLLLAGLLQDIGILAFRSILPDRYAELNNITDHDELLKLERRKFGAGHDEVGYWLLKKWRLPDHLVLACLASHVIPSFNKASGTPNSCVAASGYLADAFLKQDDVNAVQKATDAAQRCLGMDADTTLETLRNMTVSAKEFEDLFDLQFMDVDHAEVVLHELKELITITHLRTWADIEERKQRDPLTDVYNRGYFDEAFNQAFAASARRSGALSVAFIDIDNFKKINDTYGHSAGDNVLVTASNLIASQIRRCDVFARYGGDEFVLLFPETSEEAAWTVLSRIKETLESSPYLIGDTTHYTTLSVGLASHIDKATRYKTTEDMLKAADNALYMAKRNGRNQIVRAIYS
jgi:diguanylate cyclase (GGDEF)-like protein